MQRANRKPSITDPYGVAFARPPIHSETPAVTRVLLVEDNPGDAELLRRMLGGSTAGTFEVETVYRLADAINIESVNDFDLVVLDLNLPDSFGMDTLDAMRESAPIVPIVVLTGQNDERLGLEAMTRGAQDYLVKGEIDARMLSRSLRFAIERGRWRVEMYRHDALLAEAQEIAKLGSFSWDLVTDEATWSAALWRIYSMDESDGVPDRHTFLRGSHPADREHIEDSFRSAIASKEPFDFEYRIMRSGEVVHLHVRGYTAIDAAGRATRFAGTCQDVTERKHAQDALLASERRLRTLFESVNLIVLVLDVDGIVEYMNPFALALTGCATAEAFGSKWSETFTAIPDLALVTQSFEAMLRPDGPGCVQDAIRTRAGAVRVISWHNTPLKDAEGRLWGSLSVGEDVTERNRLDQQYRQAQKMEAVGRLAGGVAHDFNNMLTVILSYAELLRETFAPGDPRIEDLDPILTAAGAAAGLTRQLLSFSRQEVIQPKPILLETVVAQSGKLLQRVIGEDVTLHTNLNTAPSTIVVDAGQLEQIIVNLAVNARDAMPNGGRLTIETSTLTVDEDYAATSWPAVPGRFALLTVSDTGTGMDEQTRAQIFEPFFTTKEVGKGTGLGLATVYGIVKQSGGFIMVDSEPGVGTSFKVCLPIADHLVTLPLEPTVPAPATPRGSETILLVDDAPSVRAVARQILERAGYAVLEAQGGAVAIDIATRHTGAIDMVLTDVVMPEMSGKQLADRIVELRPATRVLYMSGYTDEAVVRHGVSDPAVAFLQKPFTPDALTRKVRDVLDERSVTVAGAA